MTSLRGPTLALPRAPPPLAGDEGSQTHATPVEDEETSPLGSPAKEEEAPLPPYPAMETAFVSDSATLNTSKGGSCAPSPEPDDQDAMTQATDAKDTNDNKATTWTASEGGMFNPADPPIGPGQAPDFSDPAPVQLPWLT